VIDLCCPESSLHASVLERRELREITRLGAARECGGAENRLRKGNPYTVVTRAQPRRQPSDMGDRGHAQWLTIRRAVTTTLAALSPDRRPA
jgi:hypothetical protein